MKTTLLSFIASSALVAGGCAEMHQAAPARVIGYEVVARYAIGGAGGWDFLSVDAKRQRLFVSRGNRVQIIDTRAGTTVAELRDTAGVHGIAIADELGLGFTS